MKIIAKPSIRQIANGKYAAFVGSEKIAEADTEAGVRALLSNRYRIDGAVS